MSRMNGQLTFQSPSTAAATGDDANSTSTRRVFAATERVTIVEVGAIAPISTTVPNLSFTFRVKKRVGGVVANDVVISVFKSAFAAEGGPGGDPSVANFDEANKITNGIITNTGALLAGGTALRAFCEVSLDKGDQLVFEVVAAGGASSTVIFYAKAYPGGAGLVESNDIESN